LPISFLVQIIYRIVSYPAFRLHASLIGPRLTKARNGQLDTRFQH